MERFDAVIVLSIGVRGKYCTQFRGSHADIVPSINISLLVFANPFGRLCLQV